MADTVLVFKFNRELASYSDWPSDRLENGYLPKN